MNERRLRTILNDEEDYNLELKAATNGYGSNKLHDYCSALANENGGFFILGVDDAKRIVGTQAFNTKWNKLAHELTSHLQIRIKVYRINTTEGRVLVFEIPRHATGRPVQVTGGTGTYRYPIRDGESLVEMDTDTLQNIFAEQQEDWSADIVKGATLKDLDVKALEKFRNRWATHMNKPERKKVDLKKMLQDLQLIQGEGVTAAALLLAGTERALTKLIPDAEIIFEWRNKEDELAYGERQNWRAGFMLIEDQIWKTINARNTVFRYQEGFAQRDIPAFDEESIREAVVNAFAHRDYSIRGRSIIIKASPEKFYIENPGRLMPGITPENIFERSEWRNRRLAEALEKIGIMERSSQGMDKIFRLTIESGKGLPKLSITHDPTVMLNIPAALEDQEFVNFLEQVTGKHQATLSLKEIIELERIRQGDKTNKIESKDKLLGLGVIERVGHGRGAKYILAHQYYKYANATGQHTRLSGLPREVRRNIIMEHLKKNKQVRNQDLQEAMPDLDMRSIYRLLKGMEKDGYIKHKGARRYGYWCIKDKESH